MFIKKSRIDRKSKGGGEGGKGKERTKGMRAELGDRIILHIVKAGPMSCGDDGGKGSRITFRN